MVIPMFVLPASAEESYDSVADYVATSETGVEIDENLQKKIYIISS
mgnify:CR=1 FL=1